jgi:tetratricopeptide (TPR) repeat protein
LVQQGRNVEGRDAMARALAYWRRVGDRRRLAVELSSLALTHRSLGEPDVARALLQESVALARELENSGRLATALSNLATVEIDDGAPDIAIDLLREALEVDRARGDAWGVTVDEVNLAMAMLRADRLHDSEQQLRAVTRQAVELDDVDLTIGVFELWVMLHAEHGDWQGAGRLVGMTDAMREQAELPRPEPDAVLLERSLAKLGAAAQGDGWDKALAQGSTSSVEQALAEVLS